MTFTGRVGLVAQNYQGTIDHDTKTIEVTTPFTGTVFEVSAKLQGLIHAIGGVNGIGRNEAFPPKTILSLLHLGIFHQGGVNEEVPCLNHRYALFLQNINDTRVPYWQNVLGWSYSDEEAVSICNRIMENTLSCFGDQIYTIKMQNGMFLEDRYITHMWASTQ